MVTVLSRCFAIDLWTTYDDGSPSELITVDLTGTRGPSRRRQLANLDDDMLATAEPVAGWPPGSEGAWIRVPVGNDTIFGQWQEDAPLPWRTTKYRFKIMRVLGRDEVEAFLTSVPPAG